MYINKVLHRLRKKADSKESEPATESHSLGRDAPITAFSHASDSEKRPTRARRTISDSQLNQPDAPSRVTSDFLPTRCTIGTTIMYSLFLVGFLSLALGEDVLPQGRFSVCHNEHTFSRRDLHLYAHEKRRTKDVVGQLFDWCSGDAACAEAYHISTNRTAVDEKTFRYISAHWLQQASTPVDLMEPFGEKVCESESFDDLLRTLWVLAMRLRVRETVRLECGANERAVFDAEAMQLHCVCAADRNCIDASVWRESSLNWSNTTVILAVVVLIVVVVQIFFTSATRRATYHRLLLECKQKCGGREILLKNL